ncbi:peptide-methionine (S)-S-oxide reductase MsrA [Cognatilysobacter bugurensis]|uniref:Peptide methionine sulfoxide reductase MsrA n=1 Tax=Cognatilysobacter bugurensis TaxID=543356 RepID=A0A918T7Y1_9GAMM|nr:peptide-methionine (S)-S-oxide reductase MsrA [Lysobacter bugurensis]GHA89743.1 peptide methionine sulfoxide reductase MsrA [Lysobacter bugurensis]
MVRRSVLEGRLGVGAYKQRMPRPESALPGRETPMPLACNVHRVLGRPLRDAFSGLARVQFGMGCFWGAERLFWSMPGVHTTAVGYAGGYTSNPTYREVCSGETGHAEVVLVVYDASRVSLDALLATFWEGHDPTQGMRQGNDLGTNYRSAIFCDTQTQYEAAIASCDVYGQRLRDAGFGPVTTGIAHPAPPFYYAEDEHQQYLARHPDGYCGLGGTGVRCPVGASG